MKREWQLIFAAALIIISFYGITIQVTAYLYGRNSTVMQTMIFHILSVFCWLYQIMFSVVAGQIIRKHEISKRPFTIILLIGAAISLIAVLFSFFFPSSKLLESAVAFELFGILSISCLGVFIWVPILLSWIEIDRSKA